MIKWTAPKIAIAVVLGVALFLVAFDFALKASREKRCFGSGIVERKELSNGTWVATVSCPEGCQVGSCNGLRTACCPEGLYSYYHSDLFKKTCISGFCFKTD